MADPFLLSHSCAPHQFTFAGPLTPVSIRDQMIRGRMFSDRAVEQRLISPKRPLLVIGAGAAGVTAALRAAQHGVPVDLVEVSHQAFGRQKGCTTRWVDPTQYDWPVDHWWRANYPWTAPAMPLPWPAQHSSAIAAIWERELRRGLRRYSHLLQFLTRSNVVPPITYNAANKDLSVSLNTPWGPQARAYGAVLHCIGFGLERASAGKFSSFQFWDADPLEKRGLGLAAPAAPLRVLIGGGGDGALQDFLRITTGLPSAAALLNALPAQARKTVTSAIQSAEDQSQRASIWCERVHEHAVFARLHQIHLQQVQQILPDPAVTQALQTVLEHAKGLEVDLAYPCSHFSRCYGLNRFLTLLLLEYAREKLAIKGIPAMGVFSVSGVHHPCVNLPWQCHGQEHKVELQPAPTCAQKPTALPTQSRNYDAVVLRLGVDPPKPFYQNSPLLITRQILPYHVTQ
jgi:hypothetical protein